MIAQARNGGSITPRYRKVLDSYIASGKISLHTNTVLDALDWDMDMHQWTSVRTNQALELPPIDHIIFATGIQSNVEEIEMLRHIRFDYPIDYVGGLPCLNDDLMWNDDVPLFVTGRLAGLRLGPGAPNLVGARIGAERIAWNVQDVLRKSESGRSERGGGGDSPEKSDEMSQFVAGRRNRFDSLIGMQVD